MKTPSIDIIHSMVTDFKYDLMNINYCYDIIPGPEQVMDLYRHTGMLRTSYHHEEIRMMLQHSNLLVTAWYKYILIGIARSVTDWNMNYYLAEIAVRDEITTKHIGRRLMELSKQKAREHSMELFVSLPLAMKFYSKKILKQQEQHMLINAFAQVH